MIQKPTLIKDKLIRSLRKIVDVKIRILGDTCYQYFAYFLFFIIVLISENSKAQTFCLPDSYNMLTDCSENCVEFIPAHGKKKGVTVVSHGLNNKPSVMLPIANWLNQFGLDVYLVKLYGHRPDETRVEQISDHTWLHEMRCAYCEASELAKKTGVPLYFLGYSLGALVGQYLIFHEKGEVQFDRQVLIAPATALRNRSHLLKATFILPGSFKLPSYTPEAYRANQGIEINFYKILFHQQKQIRKGEFAYLNFPTLVIIDEKDELISYKKLRKYIQKYNLDQYQILTLNSAEVGKTTQYHHLIVDKTSMGKENWEKVMLEIRQFLFNTKN